MGEQAGLVLRVDFVEKFHDFNWLNVYYLVYHLKDRVCELNHSLRDVQDNLFQHSEKALVQYSVVLFQHCHEYGDQHWHEGHTVRLVLDYETNAIEADLVMVSQVGVNQHFEHMMDSHGWVLVFLR